jgi:RNA polymerase sigma factor (sigma-70 family)
MSEDLVQQLRSRRSDKDLWAEFYAKLRPAVYFAVYRRLSGRRALAEDVTQDAFLRFIRYANLDTLQDEAHALAYLRQSARHLCWDRLLAERKTISLESEEGRQAGALWASDEEEHRALRWDVDHLGERLSQAERDLLTALLDGASLQEIARSFNISYGAAAVRAHRLRKKLSKQIKYLQD